MTWIVGLIVLSVGGITALMTKDSRSWLLMKIEAGAVVPVVVDDRHHVRDTRGQCESDAVLVSRAERPYFCVPVSDGL
jgi:hypothetical protein